ILRISIDIVTILVPQFPVSCRSTFEHSPLASCVSHTSDYSCAQQNALGRHLLCLRAHLLQPDRPFRDPFLPLSSFPATLTSNSAILAKTALVSPLATALTDGAFRKSFPYVSYEKHRWIGEVSTL